MPPEKKKSTFPPTDELGILIDLHTNGFGFASALTNPDIETVFLNPARVTSLAIGSLSEKLVVKMTVVRRSDGRHAALRAGRFDIASESDANLLWKHHVKAGLKWKDIHEIQSIKTDFPGAVPLLLLLGKQVPIEIENFGELIAKIDAPFWNRPELFPYLRLAGRNLILGAIPYFIVHCKESMKVELARLISISEWFDESFLDARWYVAPEERRFLLILVSIAWKLHVPHERLMIWIERASDAKIDLKLLWDNLASALNAGMKATDISKDWAPLERAPPDFLGILGRAHFPCIRSHLEILTHLGDPLTSGASKLAHECSSLDDLDIELAESWMPRGIDEAVRKSFKAQMLSARAAELQAKRYFELMGLNVKDVAFTQLDGSSEDWRLMDLLVNGQHGVDVKNVRRSPNGGYSSSKWKVKDFKADASGANVLLCGVSSPFATLNDGCLNYDRAEEILVLGVTTKGEVSALLREFSSIYIVRVNPATKLRELPAWAWDYPLAHYEARESSLVELREQAGVLSKSILGAKMLASMPPLTSCILGLPIDGEERLSTQQREFLHIFRESISHKPSPRQLVPRLPWLYLFVLHWWMAWRGKNEICSSGELADLFTWRFPIKPTEKEHELLFIESESMFKRKTKPTRPPLALSVGIPDPSDSLRNLINALASLEKFISRDVFNKISDLTLFENGVLVGTFPDASRRTLIAHCGGRRVEQNLSECGYRPLVFGKHETCDCGKLICASCGSCGDPFFADCEAQKRRHLRRLEEKDAKTHKRTTYRR